MRHIICILISMSCIGIHAADNIHTAISNKDYNEVHKLLRQDSHQVNTTDEDYNTPLHLSAQNGELDIARLLIQHGAQINDTNKYKMTPLHDAVQKGQNEMCKFCIRQNADLNQKDILGDTPLHHVAWGKNEIICKLLVQHGAHINTRNESGKTPLHIAAQKEHFDMCQLFIHHGATINAIDNKHVTPLHHAAIKGHYDICKTLLEWGANPNAPDKNHNTPIDVAHHYEYYAIENLLHKAQAIHNGTLWKNISPDNLHYKDDIKMALSCGAWNYVQEILADAQASYTDPITINTELFLHAEHLRAAHTNTPHLDTFIQHNLQHKDLINDMLHTMCTKVMDTDSTPVMFKRILGRYHDYVNGHFDKLNKFPQLTEYHTLRDIICNKYIINTAHRIRNKEATTYEIAACIEYAINTVIRYRDPETGNTFLHELAHDPTMIRFVPTIAREIMHNPKHNARNNHKKTPVMIAQEKNNDQFVALFRDYYNLNALTQYNPLREVARTFLLYISSQANTGSTRPRSTMGNTLYDYVLEEASTLEKLPHNIKWDIIEKIYGTY